MKPGMPFGVDLLIPKVGGGARATNKDRDLPRSTGRVAGGVPVSVETYGNEVTVWLQFGRLHSELLISSDRWHAKMDGRTERKTNKQMLREVAKH